MFSIAFKQPVLDPPLRKGNRYPLNDRLAPRLDDGGIRNLLLIHHVMPANEERGRITSGDPHISSESAIKFAELVAELSKICPELSAIFTATDACSRETAELFASRYPDVAIYARGSDGYLNRRPVPEMALGKHLEEIQKENPALYLHLVAPNEMPQTTYPGSMSYNEFYSRVSCATQQIAENIRRGTTVGVVTHGSVISAGIRHLLGLPYYNLGAHTEYGSLTWATISKSDGRMSVLFEHFSETFMQGDKS
ncbi:Histidine phosphatase superfamily (branch 1) [uncultured archaeon]|nr:Histidine phosphatase superfamily (branch 1) [uncultured archaeon]